MEKSLFEKHPSQSLNELYSKRNYQGANPVEAQVLFVGRDPNWAFDIETKEMFNYVSEYFGKLTIFIILFYYQIIKETENAIIKFSLN